MSKTKIKRGHVTLRNPIIGWKKAEGPRGGEVLLKLSIPANARIYSANTNSASKCRADRAVVLEAWGIRPDFYGTTRGVRSETMSKSTTFCPFVKCGIDLRVNGKFQPRYRIGDLIEPFSPFSTEEQVCASGIHFFRDRRAAINYG